jgi:hypothetical protein
MPTEEKNQGRHRNAAQQLNCFVAALIFSEIVRLIYTFGIVLLQKVKREITLKRSVSQMTWFPGFLLLSFIK